MAGKTKGLERRSVVSCFIFHFPNKLSDEPLVALFKRGDKVSTYKHRIAPISGSISRSDKNPLDAAWRELSEETGLNRCTLTYWRAGKPFSFVDEDVNREWTVHPFAFQLKGTPVGSRRDSAIHLDWEHEEWKWHNPNEVIDDGIFKNSEVPHLREALRRVWPEGQLSNKAAQALRTGLEQLANDHEHGSHELTSIALKAFRDVIVQMQGLESDKWWEYVQMTAWHLVKNGRESMATATLNALLAILEEMEEIWRMDPKSEWRLERFLTVIDHHLKSRTSRAELVKEMFASYVRDNFLLNGQSRDKLTILTLSASSTIRDSIVEAFASLDIALLELRVLESRPLFEGISISSSILSHFREKCKDHDKKLQLNIYTDASAAIAATDADIILLGADCISRSKGVSNKTGSLPVVLSAKHVAPKAKIVVLSELEKVNGENGLIDDERDGDNDPNELIMAWSNEEVKGAKEVHTAYRSACRAEKSNYEVHVHNIYLEWVPLDLVDAFVSGEGVLSDSRIHEKANQQLELASRYFDSIPVRY
ncbi:hypothetical protein BDV18DRAFT_136437 [Aspergillus unguis]